MKYKILILTIMIFLIPKDTQASFVGTSPRPSPNCSTGINCGLVGYWTFDGNDIVNGVIKDVSGRGNNGNTISIASSTFYVPGKIGQAVNFDGVNNYLEVGSAASPSSAITISAWVYWNGGSNYPSILCRTSAFDEATAKYCFYIKLGTGGVGQLSFSMGGGKVTQTTLLVPKNKWTFVSVVRGAGSATATLYMNNASLVIGGTGGSGDYADPTYSSELARIGTFFTGANQGRFPGSIDDVRIYNRALSVQEIQQLYSTGAATKVATSKPVSSTCVSDINCGLVGYWTFDGKDIVNGVIKDVSGNGNDGNPLNIASSTFYAPGKIGQGVKSKGSDYVVVPDSTSLKPSGAMSWGGWSYHTTKNTNQAFLSKITLSTSGYMLYNSLGTQEYCFAYGLTPNNWSDGVPIEKDKWVHYMCVYDGSTLKIYRNGVLKSFTSVTGSITHSTNQLKFPSYGSGGFIGSVDDIRVYNRALSDKEVMQLYNMGAATKVGVSPSATSTPACSTGLSCGLVGYWTFDGKDINTNGVLLDKSGNGKNAYKVNISTTTLNAPGKIGQGANFDGVGYVSVGDNFDLIGSPFTLAAWIYPKSYAGTSSNTPGVIDKLWTGGNYRLNVPSGVVSFGIRSSDGTFESVSGTGNSAPLFKWTHVVVTYDNVATGKIYVNGVLNNSKTNFTVSRGDTTAPLLIGSNSNNPNSNFNGKIDDVRIYNRVLSAQEIQQLYSQSR